MKRVLYLMGLAVLVVIFSQSVNSQTLNVGVSGGVNRFFHTSKNAEFYWSSPDMLTKDGLNDNNITFTCGIVTEIIPSNSSRSSFQFRLSYNSYSFKSDFKEITDDRTDVDIPEYIYPTGKNLDTIVEYVYLNEFTLQSLSVDLLYKYNLFDNLSVLAGTKLNYYYNTQIYAGKFLVRPFAAQYKRQEGKVYTDNDRTIVVYKENEIKDFARFNLGLSMGLQYSIKLSGFEINPFLKYDMYLTEFMTGKEWKLTTYNLGVDFMFSI